MATQTIDTGVALPVQEVRRTIFPAAPVRVSWSAVFAGAITALGIWILLYAFGVAVGLSALNPDSTTSLKGSGIFTGIWSLLVPLIALFCGGIVAAFSASPSTRSVGAVHGIVVWALTSILVFMFFASLIGSAINMAGEVGRTAAEATGGAVSQGLKSFSLDANKALGPLNAKLESEGKPPVTAEQLNAATSDVLNNAVVSGTLNKETVTESIAANTDLSKEEAEQLADRVEQQFNDAKGKLSEAGQAVGRKAIQVSNTTGKLFWGVFASLALALISAVLGGIVGARRKAEHEERAVAVR
jgi:hypothetical protein